MVIVGVDAHKGTHTFVAIDEVGRKLGEKTCQATSDGHAEVLRWARQKFGRDLRWGIEDCRQVTARLEHDLLASKENVVRVPTRLMSRARSKLRERGKSDAIDALAVARATLSEPDLPIAFHDDDSWEMQLLVGRREDLVRQRTALINRFLWRVHWLAPERPSQSLQTTKSRLELHDWLRGESGLVADLARDELCDIDRLTTEINDLAKRIGVRIRAIAPRLLDVPGCGELSAAKIVAEAAGVHRFRSESAWASYIGVAPKPHWSAGQKSVPFRVGRWGNRQLNMAVHRIAVTQIRYEGQGRDYFQRRLAEEGNSRTFALRCLKRQVAKAVYRAMVEDQSIRVLLKEETALRVAQHPGPSGE